MNHRAQVAAWSAIPICTAAALLLPSASFAASPRTTSKAMADQCLAGQEALRAYAQQAGSLVLSKTPPQLSGAVDGAFLSSGWTGEQPDASLIARAPELSKGSSMACEGVEVFARSSHFTIIDGQAEAELLKFPPKQDVPFIHRIGAPVVSADGKEAVVLVASVRSGLGGTQQLLFMRKSGSQWRLSGRKVLGIS